MNAVYARQSVDKKDSVSIETQVESCTRFLDGDYQVYRDRGFSGKNINRPAFAALLQDIESGKITKVWVYRLDRFSRSILDFGQLWALLERHRVEFESVSEKFDTSTPGGRAMLNIIMTFAQLERETIAQRVRDNYYHRFALGAWPGGPAPLGFALGRVPDTAGRQVPTLLPDANAALIVRIYESYLTPDASLGSVARGLSDANIQGRSWDSVAISRILKNPVYVRADGEVYLHFLGQGIPIEQPVEQFVGDRGCHLVGKRDRGKSGKTTPRLSLGNHGGIVSAELWLACQKKLAGNRQLDRSHVGKYSWLSGLLKCAGCGYAVKINRCHDTFYLHCSGHTNLGVCQRKIRVDLGELEQAVGQAIAALLAQCP
ncbi:MAG: recombinase family protein, partial [Oscillospiraceae bacterium]